MLPRELEPEVMDTIDEALTYDAMDHRAVNRAFAADALSLRPNARRILDVGTGTGLIAIVIATRAPLATVTGVDLSEEMLRVAARNVARARLLGRVALARVDAKTMPYRQGDFDLVVSNSVAHHVPDPRMLFAEIARIAGESGAVFVRDLARPSSAEELDALVARHASHERAAAREQFRASLHAALTPEEVSVLAAEAGLKDARVSKTSDRHWTLTRG